MTGYSGALAALTGAALLSGMLCYKIAASLPQSSAPNPQLSADAAMPAPSSVLPVSLQQEQPSFVYQCGIAFDSRLPQQFKDAHCQALSLLPAAMQSFVTQVVLQPKDEWIEGYKDRYGNGSLKYLSIVAAKLEMRVYPNTLKSAIKPGDFIHEYCHVVAKRVYDSAEPPSGSEFGKAYFLESKTVGYISDYTMTITEGFAEACAKVINRDPIMNQLPLQRRAIANIFTRANGAIVPGN